MPGKTVALQEESRKVKLNALATETAAAVESEEIFCKFGTLNGFSKENVCYLFFKWILILSRLIYDLIAIFCNKTNSFPLTIHSVRRAL